MKAARLFHFPTMVVGLVSGSRPPKPNFEPASAPVVMAAATPAAASTPASAAPTPSLDREIPEPQLHAALEDLARELAQASGKQIKCLSEPRAR